ncbi:monovalent cation/H(+) antiporter subunit G [Halorientalis brevis]|uniref:Monovalent cation/H(+) antiporter subunit G n=1 Tax=Halorientalis brevis TaxID=1126241 RepID=A0ABD6CGH7_9EURY
MTLLELAVVLCVCGAVLFFGIATLGLFRLPDLYSRAHATSKGDTLGTLFAIGGAILASGGDDTTKLLFLVGFVFVTTPTATHAIVHAADVEGYDAWTSGGDEGT